MNDPDRSPGLEEYRVPIEGVTLQAVRSGSSRPPLLFLHGVTRSWQTFLPLLPSLMLRWQIHAFDFRGHGRSERCPGGYLVTDYITETVSFIRNQIQQPVVIHGHSLGAMVTAGVAAAVPELVGGIILEDPPFDTMGTRYLRTRLASYFAGMHALAGSTRPLPELAKAVGKLPMTDPETSSTILLETVRDPTALRYQAHCLAQVDPEVLTPIVAGHWLDGYSWQEIVTGIRCPVLLLQADLAAGGMLTDEDATSIVAHIADCTHELMRGGTHMLHWSCTQEILQRMTQFLETVTL